MKVAILLTCHNRRDLTRRLMDSLAISLREAAWEYQIFANDDGSTDLYFGPTAPEGYEKNWIQTIEGKGWFVILRIYGPLEPWFDKSWKPGEIELMSGNPDN